MDKPTKDIDHAAETRSGDAASFASRRTVIKGISSLPIVATLATGRPAAAASALQCAANGLQTAPTVGTVLEIPTAEVLFPGATVIPPVVTMEFFSRVLVVPSDAASEPVDAFRYSVDGFLYEHLGQSTIDPTREQFTAIGFTVDADGSNVATPGVPLMASCYNSAIFVG